jgi:hypothetical protein
MAAVGAIACVRLIPVRRARAAVEELPVRSEPAEAAA